jgi:hypothetical protein
VLFRYIGLLASFNSDTDELNLSLKDRSLRIRKIPEKEIQEFLFSERMPPSIEAECMTAVDLGKDMFWLDYQYEVEDSREAMIRATNSAYEDMEKAILILRLFKEGYVRIVFDVKKGEHIPSTYTMLRGLRSNERSYFMAKSELRTYRVFYKNFANLAWEKKKSKGSLSIALSRFADGYERIRLEDRMIDYVIGLEALYLQREGEGEFGYKMAHRVSILLSRQKKSRSMLFREIKKSYRLRSKIVHGGRYELLPENVWFVEDALRDSIKKFLRVEKPDWLKLI